MRFLRLKLLWIPVFGSLFALSWIGVAHSRDSVDSFTSNDDGAHRADSYQLITGEDDEAEREHWNRIFRTQTFVYGEQPAPFVRQSLPLMRRGRALVLAMEEGRNAIFLARHGFEVTGIDFSDEAIRKAKRLARKHGVKLHVVNADLNTYNIEPESYDVIVAVDFYRPRLISEIRKGLKHGGTVVFESSTTSQLKHGSERTLRSDHLLKPGALGVAFADYAFLAGGEDDRKAIANIVARKP